MQNETVITLREVTKDILFSLELAHKSFSQKLGCSISVMGTLFTSFSNLSDEKVK